MVTEELWEVMHRWGLKGKDKIIAEIRRGAPQKTDRNTAARKGNHYISKVINKLSQ